MQQSDSNIVVRGANVVNLGRRAADTLRNRMHRSRETAETLANSAPTQNNPGNSIISSSKIEEKNSFLLFLKERRNFYVC